MFTEISKNYAALQAHARKIDGMIKRKRWRNNSRVKKQAGRADIEAFIPMSTWEQTEFLLPRASKKDSRRSTLDGVIKANMET